jgi:Spy/CpxP family protein refolding chaperone
MDRFLFLLDLNPAQIAQVKATRSEARESASSNIEALRATEEDLRAVVESASFEEARAGELAARAAQLQGQLRLIQARMDNAVWRILTEEQRAKLAELRQRRPQAKSRN